MGTISAVLGRLKTAGYAQRMEALVARRAPLDAPSSATAAVSRPQYPADLSLPSAPSLTQDLLATGASEEAILELEQVFHRAAQRAQASIREQHASLHSALQYEAERASELRRTLQSRYAQCVDKLKQDTLSFARRLVEGGAREAGGTRSGRFNALYKPVLEQSFAANPYPGAEEREFLAKKTGMSRKQVDSWFVNKRMRTVKHERSEPRAPHLTFVHYDVPGPDLDSMVDQLGGIAYARGASVLSQASDDYQLPDGPDGEDDADNFSADDEVESSAGADRERCDKDADVDTGSDVETIYWSTDEDVSGKDVKPTPPRKRRYLFDAPVPSHAYPAKFPAPRMLQAQPPLATPWRRNPTQSCARHRYLTVDQLANEFGRLSVKPVIVRERLPKRLDHPLNSYRRLHPPSERLDRSSATCAYTTIPPPALIPWVRALPSLPVKVKSLPLLAKLVQTAPDLCPAAFASSSSNDWPSFAVKPRARILIGKRRTSGSVAAVLPASSWREFSPFVRDEPASPRPEPALLWGLSPSPPLEEPKRLRHSQKRARSREPRAASPAVSEPARKRARTSIPRLPSLDIASAASSPASSTGPLTPKTPAMRISPRKVATLPRRAPTSAPKGQVPQIPTRPSSVASFRSFTSASDGSVVDTPASVAMTLVDDAELAAPAPLKKAAAFGWAEGGPQSIADLDWLHSPEVQDEVRASSNRTPRLGDYFA